jgi:hypothetical protein
MMMLVMMMVMLTTLCDALYRIALQGLKAGDDVVAMVVNEGANRGEASSLSDRTTTPHIYLSIYLSIIISLFIYLCSMSTYLSMLHVS